jgi:hypothetical protein
MFSGGLSRRVLVEGIEFWAFLFANWVWDSQEEARAAGERFEQAAVCANMTGQARFLYTTESIPTLMAKAGCSMLSAVMVASGVKFARKVASPLQRRPL